MHPAAEAGQHELVRRALERLTDAGLATSKDWAHLVRAHVAERKFHNAELALGEMIASGHKPEMAVFHDVLRAKASDLRRGDASVVLQRMAQCGMPPDLLTYNLALRMCYGGTRRGARRQDPGGHGCGGPRPRQAHVQSDAQSVALWMCLLNTLSMCGQPQHTLAAAARMAERGCAPTATAHLFVVKAHAELGDGAAFAVSVAHDAGDAATADALWREVGGAAHFGLYKALAPPKEGKRRGWTVLMDHPVRQPHAQRTVLDLSSRTCVDGVLHAALRAEAARLRTQPPPATVYIYIAGATTPPRVARTAVFHALVASLSMHVSAVPPTPGLFKASVRAHEQTKSSPPLLLYHNSKYKAAPASGTSYSGDNMAAGTSKRSGILNVHTIAQVVVLAIYASGWRRCWRYTRSGVTRGTCHQHDASRGLLNRPTSLCCLPACSQTCFPKTTCVTQGCLLSVVGDAISQAISQRQEPPEPGARPIRYCWKRFAIAGMAGCLFDGLAIPVWYGYLHGIVPNGLRFRGLALTAIDLALLSTCGNFANMMFRNLLAGGSLTKAWRETRSKITGVILVDLRIFPAYDILMFTFVPRHVQALCTAAVCCLWNCYLSSVTAESTHAHPLKSLSVV
ncbi:hypothetical protein JKP88DRAFT_335094 [Tribonema minus]|uniref:Pentatricopeptide repeat-containing protein n=1 Tax=Tribonema minus TaxID=303371 RepID=A0A835YMB6_9STRA|nr:hypothetical protein JKP88DRAFT_335094 [Tribonema minus]